MATRKSYAYQIKGNKLSLLENQFGYGSGQDVITVDGACINHKQYTLDERKNDTEKFYTTDRPRKHRYFYLLADKKEKKEMNKNLAYDIHKYPKGVNRRYDATYKPTVQGILF